jgi:hypothetical protein
MGSIYHPSYHRHSGALPVLPFLPAEAKGVMMADSFSARKALA